MWNVEGREEDLYIPEDKVNGAFHKDTVQVTLLGEQTGKRQEACVVRILARGMTQVVGTYEVSHNNYGFVIPIIVSLRRISLSPRSTLREQSPEAR